MSAVAEAEKVHTSDDHELFRGWRKSMKKFVNEAIIAPYNKANNTADRLTSQQEEFCEELTSLMWDKYEGRRRHIKGLSVQAAKGLGKDYILACAIIWILSCFRYPKIPCISVGERQLKHVLWSEVSKLLRHSLVKEFITHESEAIYVKDPGLAKDEIKKRWSAFPIAANPKETGAEEDAQVVSLQGLHEDILVIACDEVSGVKTRAMKTLEENCTGALNLMILIFNPTLPKGYAIDSQTTDSENWVCLQWSAEDSPLVNREKIAEIERKYGRESNPFRVNVLGLPPLVDSNTLIQPQWIEDAIECDLIPRETDPVVLGVDCGAERDSSVIARRKGPRVFPFERKKTAERDDLVNWVGSYIDRVEPDVVRVDAIGVGWDIAKDVRKQKHSGVYIEGVKSSRKSYEPERFKNLRALMYWRLAEAFEKGEISIPNDPELINQLSILRMNYEQLPMQLMSKKEMKTELGHSPDEADALALTYLRADDMVSKTWKEPKLVNMPMKKRNRWMVR